MIIEIYRLLSISFIDVFLPYVFLLIYIANFILRCLFTTQLKFCSEKGDSFKYFLGFHSQVSKKKEILLVSSYLSVYYKCYGIQVCKWATDSHWGIFSFYNMIRHQK